MERLKLATELKSVSCGNEFHAFTTEETGRCTATSNIHVTAGSVAVRSDEEQWLGVEDVQLR